MVNRRHTYQDNGFKQVSNRWNKVYNICVASFIYTLGETSTKFVQCHKISLYLAPFPRLSARATVRDIVQPGIVWRRRRRERKERSPHKIAYMNLIIVDCVAVCLCAQWVDCRILITLSLHTLNRPESVQNSSMIAQRRYRRWPVDICVTRRPGKLPATDTRTTSSHRKTLASEPLYLRADFSLETAPPLVGSAKLSPTSRNWRHRQHVNWSHEHSAGGEDCLGGC